MPSWLRWPSSFIAIFVAVNLLLPFSYYVARLDEHDERFAWRMFSPTRMVRCSVAMTVDGRAIALEREFHQAWIETAQRGRRQVVEAMGAHLCRKHPRAEVIARLTCRPLRGAPYPMGGFDLCTIPEL